MHGILCLFVYIIITMALGCIISYASVMKKIAKSNDVGTKVKLIEFSTDESNSKFYCDTDVDPGKIIANTSLHQPRDPEETEND